MPGLRTWLLVIHILFWLALVREAYLDAGDYAFASCWMIIPSFFFPIGILMVGLAGYSVIILWQSRARPALRQHWGFSIASHGMTVTAGWVGCYIAALVATGQVSCL
jgi:hypothetical protein